MDPRCSFRKALLRRLLDVVGVAAIANPALHAGCGRVVLDLDGAGGSGTGGARGFGGQASDVGSGSGADGGSCELTSTAASTSSGAGQFVEMTECVEPLTTGCPSQYEAAQYIIPTNCAYLVLVECGPVMESANCCYLVKEELHACPPGRPFFAAGELRTSSLVMLGDAREHLRAVGDGGWTERELAPSTLGLDHAARSALAAAWTRDALFEHASVASFARFALELMAVGAPADLVAEAHRAALDEVRHARLCFGLSEGYGGEVIAPSPFPFGGHVEVAGDLAALAATTARDGCIGETLAALMAAEQRTLATDPAVRRALALIAEDEARHAELAWRTVAWAIAEGGPPVRAAVLEVFGNAARHLPFGAGAVAGIDPAIAAAHGRLDAEQARRATVRAIAEVIMPCEAALFAGRAPVLGDARERLPAESGVRATLRDWSPVTRRSPS